MAHKAREMGLEFTVKDLKLLGGGDVYASHKQKFDDMKKWPANPFKDFCLKPKGTTGKVFEFSKAFIECVICQKRAAKGCKAHALLCKKCCNSRNDLSKDNKPCAVHADKPK